MYVQEGFNMEHERKKGTVTVRVTGELDHCSAQSIRRELDALIAEPGTNKLVLDLHIKLEKVLQNLNLS